jgi:hypothetical protein
MNTNSDEQFTISKANKKYFQERVKHWQLRLGLLDWEIQFDNDIGEDRLAQVYIDSEGRLATISIAETWSMFPSELELDRTAFHECFEILLNVLSSLCCKAEKDKIEEAEHVIIRTMENLVIERVGDKAAKNRRTKKAKDSISALGLRLYRQEKPQEPS